MENVARAVVELAELIKKPKELYEVADELGRRFKLSDEEIKKRDEYNLLIQKGNKLTSELEAIDKKNKAAEEKLAAAKEAHAEKVVKDKAEFEDALKGVEALKSSYAGKDKELAERENLIFRKEEDLYKRELGISAKENELRVREERVSEREEKMKKVVEAMG